MGDSNSDSENDETQLLGDNTQAAGDKEQTSESLSVWKTEAGEVRVVLRGAPSAEDATIGPYKLLQKIGSGGMGEVWMAEQERPIRRKVAIKLIKQGLDNQQVLARFEAERQAVALMDHENIAKIFDAGTTEEGSPYFVMELVDGIPLTKFCDEQRMSIRERLALFIPVCRAIQHAHQKGIIHRDLKPTNVLVCLQDGKALPKVIDFGLAKALKSNIRLSEDSIFTEFGQIVGTVQYMSPEQASLNPVDVDTRTDIYSLGVILYELLTGSTPIQPQSFRSLAIQAILASIRDQEPPRPSMRLSSIEGGAISGISQQRSVEPQRLKHLLKGELDWIVMKSLDKDRKRRYETPSDFAVDIQNFLAGNVVSARPTTTLYRSQKFIRRNRGVVASVSSIVLLLLISTLAIGRYALQAKDSLKQAEAARVEAVRQGRYAIAESQRAEIQKQNAENAYSRSQYHLAIARWDADRAREALDYLDQVAQKDRDLEWRLARNQFEGGYATLYGHAAGVTSVVFHLDGTRVISGCVDGSVIVWDVSVGKGLMSKKLHSAAINCIDFSSDGRLLATGSDDHTIALTDFITGEVKITLAEHPEDVQCVQFSRDAQHVVSSDSLGNVMMWRTVDGERLWSIKVSEETVTALAFTLDGKSLLIGLNSGELLHCSAETGREESKFENHESDLSCVDVSPDGKWVVTGGYDKSVVLRGLNDGKQAWRQIAHSNELTRVRFSRDGNLVVSSSADGTIKLWQVANGMHVKTLRGHRRSVTGFDLSVDGQRLVSTSEDFTLKLWDFTIDQEALNLRIVGDSLIRAEINSSGTKIVSLGFDKTIRVWDVATGALQRKIGEHNIINGCFSLIDDGRQVVAPVSPTQLAIWELDTGVELARLDCHVQNISTISQHCNGKRIVCANSNGVIGIVSFQADEQPLMLERASGAINSVACSRDARWIAGGGKDKFLRIWDANSGRMVQAIEARNGQINCVGFSANSKLIACGGWENEIKIWDVETGHLRNHLRGHRDAIQCLDFSEDGSRLVSGDWDGAVKLWDLNNDEELRTLAEHRDVVTSVQFGSDGDSLLSSSWDGSIKLRVFTDLPPIRMLRGSEYDIFSVSFTPNGKFLLASYVDGTMKAWDVQTGNELTSKFYGSLSGGDTGIDYSFSDDGSRVYLNVYQYRFEKPNSDAGYVREVWDNRRICLDLPSFEPMEFVEWPEDFGAIQVPAGRKWLVVTDRQDLGLVDLERQYSADAILFRKRKASVNCEWQRIEADVAEEAANWFSATFHLAWLIKGEVQREGELLDDELVMRLEDAYLQLESPEQLLLKGLVDEANALVGSGASSNGGSL